MTGAFKFYLDLTTPDHPDFLAFVSMSRGLFLGWISLWPKPLWPMDVWAHTLGPISHLGQFHFGPNLTLDNLILTQDSLAHGH